MIEVVIDSIRVSLMSQERLVVLLDPDSDRYLPVWIGPCEADAITLELQDKARPRPLTHDLLRNVIDSMDGKVLHVIIRSLRKDIFHAHIVIEVGERKLEIDSRTSDAIALAVRTRSPIYVEDEVMREAGIRREGDIEEELGPGNEDNGDEAPLSVFEDFLDTLDLDDLEDDDQTPA